MENFSFVALTPHRFEGIQSFYVSERLGSAEVV